MPSTDQPHGKTNEEMNAALADLHATLQELPPDVNKHDRAIVCIAISIELGIDTTSGIIRTLMSLGFHNGHVAAVLKSNTGTNPARYRWSRDHEGRYCNLDVPSTLN